MLVIESLVQRIHDEKNLWSIAEHANQGIKLLVVREATVRYRPLACLGEYVHAALIIERELTEEGR